MAPRTRRQAAAEASEARTSLLSTIAELVFLCLPLSVQAITLPALSKFWQQWAREQQAKERALRQAESFHVVDDWVSIFFVPLWAAQQLQQRLSDEQKRRFQLRAIALGGVGAVDAVDWLGTEPGDRAGQRRLCVSAARGGKLEALQWLRERGCKWGASTCTAAAEGGHSAVLQWARANGCEWNAFTCSAAAGYGHLAVLQWARTNGCDWDAHTCSDAARGGHLAVLQWARANGCHWNAETCYEAARGGHLAVLQWARANGCD
jgi:hypothetical protein